MARITPDELWRLVVESGLVAGPAAAALRAEHDAVPAMRAADAKAVAAWLVDRGVLTRWQARRLAAGDRGPFVCGEYRLLERHEHDGDAFEFTARHEPSGRIVTVVLLAKQRWRDPVIRAAILRRTAIAAEVADPMFVRTWALDERDGRPFAVCEEVRGESLADELSRRGPLPLREAGEIVLAAARAVAELHAAGDVHGGLSLDAFIREPGKALADCGTSLPEQDATPADRGNPRRFHRSAKWKKGVDAFFHGQRGRLRLRQFPLATDPHRAPPRASVADEAELVRLGRRAAFVAPELAAGAACDARSDVYALGCILHALVTGVAPNWDGDARRTLGRAAATGPGPLDPRLAPAPLAALVDAMTTRDPDDRYADATEAARAIAACFGFPQPDPVAPPPRATAEFAFDVPTSAGGSRVAARHVDPQAARAAVMEAAHRRGRLLRSAAGVLVGGVLAAAAATVVVRTPPKRRPPSRDPAETVAAPAQKPESAIGERPKPQPVAAQPARPPGAAASAPTSTAETAAVPTIEDDPTLLWASPTAGSPPEIAYLPAGTQVVVVARPADLHADEEGRLLVKALGPGVEAALAEVAAACGCAPGDIETLQAGWPVDETGGPVVAWAATLVERKSLPADEAFRTKAWGLEEKISEEETIRQRDGAALAYWAPTSAQGRVLVAAPDDRLREVVKASAAADPPPLALPGDLERLRGMLDGSRHVTVLGPPHSLIKAGRALFAGVLEPLVPEIEPLLGETVQAAALSVHCGTDFYVELDAAATPDEPPKTLARRLDERIQGYPQRVKKSCSARDLHPYGRGLVMELPAMMRALAARVRSGPEDGVAIANAYLPRHAGHNIVLAAGLALEQASATTPVAATGSRPAAPQDAMGKLGKPMTLAFAKDTLEKSIQMISDEIGVPMEIAGPDLQLEGITKNQSFTLDERGKPAGEILRVILAKANPEGKLCYVVRAKDGVESIEITTRAAAARRGDALPARFQNVGDPPKKGTR